MRTPYAAVLTGLVVATVALTAQSPQPSAPAPQPTAQAPEPVPGVPPVTFRVQVDYVELDALVTDAQGKPVRDLTREDFEVLEDKVPQKIDLFSFFEVPVTRPDQPLFSPTPIEPDVRLNAPFDGRLYVIVLDDLHTYALRSTLVKKAARQFIEKNMGANDVAAVVHLSGRNDAGQEFTSSKRLLLAAVDRFMGRKLRSATAGRLESYQNSTNTAPDQNGQVDKIKDPDAFERGYNARASLDSMASLAKFLEGIRGRRKALLYFGEGIDYDIHNVFENNDASVIMDSVRNTIGAATRANVAIYTIDPRGLTQLADETIEMSGTFPEDPRYGISNSTLQDELRRSQDSLRVLAEETGGYAAVNSNDFSGAFERVVRDNSTYYVLGYYPTNDRRDGRVRKIDVRVKRPGLTVHARKSYVAPRGKPDAPKTETAGGTSPKLRDALGSPLPDSGLAMAVSAAAFKGVAPKASVLVTIQTEGGRFRFTDKDGQSLDRLEVSLMAIDTKGKIQGGDKQTVELKLKAQTRQAVEAAGFRTLSRMELAPGRYQLRVGAMAGATESVGTVYYDLEVPDFSKDVLSVSGLVVSSNFAGITPTARADDQLKDILKPPPTTARDFSVADTIWTFAEVYDNQVKTPHQVDIRTLLRANDGRIVAKIEETRSTDELQGAKGGFGHVTQIPLKDVAPGQYVLRVEAQTRLSGSTTVARETLVRVWPIPQQRPPAAQAPPARTVVSVAKGAQSTVNAYRTVIARNETEWQTLWGTVPMRRAAPKVNFENTMVVGVFLGSRPSAGYAVEVSGVKEENGALVVEYFEREPAEGTASADVITTPFAIAGVPMHAGDVRFEKIPAPPK